MDLGISGIKNDDSTNVGTLHYMSPETLSDEVTETDTPIDIWSLGVIMYVLLFNAYPFEGTTRI